MNVAARIRRLEATRNGGHSNRVDVVSIYPGETRQEAWSRQRPGEILPQSGLTVFLTKFARVPATTPGALS